MRIITGSAKGVHLYSPQGDAVRPTTEMTKEGVFSAIQFELYDKEFLDLFCGSGQMGLEALSRGAASATFVDCSEDSLAVTRKNAEKTKLGPKCKIVRAEYGEYIKACMKRKKQFDMIFADAPYGKDLAPELVKRIFRADMLRSGGLLMVETANPELDTVKIPDEVMAQIAEIKPYKFSKCFVYFVRRKNTEGVSEG